MKKTLEQGRARGEQERKGEGRGVTNSWEISNVHLSVSTDLLPQIKGSECYKIYQVSFWLGHVRRKEVNERVE